MTIRRTLLTILAGVFIATLPPSAQAQKGGGGGGTGGGLIYFTLGGQPSTMNADGSAKAPLPAGVSGEPSRGLHAGHRWFLQVRDIEGESYPDGGQRREVFAVRGDGDEAFTRRLTDQPDVQLFAANRGYTRWSPGDAQVSWVAARWVDGALADAGVYSSALTFDGDGNIAGLSAQPLAPLIPCALVNDQGLRPSIRGHDWSPDGTRIVLQATPTGTHQLFIATVATGQSVLLTTSVPASVPVWSPAGTKIAFVHAAWGGGISTINAAGGGQALIAGPKGGKFTQFWGVEWSPTGTHIMYNKAGSVLNDEREDIYRVTSTGGSSTNLTSSVNTRSLSGTPARTVGWR